MNALRDISFKNVVILSVIIRIILIIYSEWHDRHAVVKYTDIDYRIFTDAARFLMHPFHTPDLNQQTDNIAKGPLGRYFIIGDPYFRETYRYTPLLALILTPNIWLHATFGKFLFSLCDIVVGVLLHRLLLSTVLPKLLPENERRRKATLYASLHLLSPMVFSISTRGSSESTLGALVIGTLYFAMTQSKRRWDLAAVMLGVSAHWKVYPIIYGVSIVAVIASERGKEGKGEEGLWKWTISLVNPQSIRFALLSAGTFMFMNGIVYLIWGYPFLYETYLYHIHRLDGAHNFSPYWLPIQLAQRNPDHQALWQRIALSPLVSFVPQMTLTLGTGLVYGRKGVEHLPFTWFIQTAIFVTLNKVCTSQYFLWYLTIFPLVLPYLSFTTSKAISLIAVWVGAQAIWLKFAYDLEFLHQPVHYTVWGCSILFLLMNCWEIVEIIRAYQWTPIRGDATTKKTE